jgi:hypothetical protein
VRGEPRIILATEEQPLCKTAVALELSEDGVQPQGSIARKSTVTRSTVCNESTLAVDGGLFENIDFDKTLSQQI